MFIGKILVVVFINGILSKNETGESLPKDSVIDCKAIRKTRNKHYKDRNNNACNEVIEAERKIISFYKPPHLAQLSGEECFNCHLNLEVPLKSKHSRKCFMVCLDVIPLTESDNSTEGSTTTTAAPVVCLYSGLQVPAPLTTHHPPTPYLGRTIAPNPFKFRDPIIPKSKMLDEGDFKNWFIREIPDSVFEQDSSNVSSDDTGLNSDAFKDDNEFFSDKENPAKEFPINKGLPYKDYPNHKEYHKQIRPSRLGPLRKTKLRPAKKGYEYYDEDRHSFNQNTQSNIRQKLSQMKNNLRRNGFPSKPPYTDNSPFTNKSDSLEQTKYPPTRKFAGKNRIGNAHKGKKVIKQEEGSSEEKKKNSMLGTIKSYLWS